MKTVRRGSLAGLFAVLALVLGVITPNAARADEVTSAPWPLELQTNNMLPDHMVAFGGNDGLSLVNCGNTQQASAFEYLYEGTLRSSLPQYNSTSSSGVMCGGNQGLATADGTFYTTYQSTSSRFMALKNDRELWNADVSSNPGTCSAAGGSQAAVMTFASQGSDGNIYGIIQSTSTGCATYLAKVNAVNGQIMFKQQLTVDGSNKGSRLWVYSDKLLAVDYAGNLRQFDLNGTENTAAAYQFPNTWGYGSFYANANGRVFMVATTSCSSSTPDTFIAYRDLNGTTGSGATGLGCNPSVGFTPGGNGTMVAYTYSGYIETFSFTSSGITHTAVNLPVPSGAVSTNINQYWQDTNNNAVVTRQEFGPNWSFVGVTVDRIDGATGAVTNLFSMTQDATHPSPYLRVADVTPDGSTLYVLACHTLSQCPNSASTSIDEWIHKIPLSSFGAPVKDTGSFTTYTNPNRTYVAMGDSFSSGESDSPFLDGTNNSGYDMCHRSSAAYPELLSGLVSNLSLTDFVACSGASTTDITSSSSPNNQKNNEPAQIDALDDRTKVVTLTVGGNDIGFPDFANACVTSFCSPGTAAYTNAINGIYALPGVLKPTYEQILQAAPNAQVYVLDYPQVVGLKAPSDPYDVRCPYLYDASGTYASSPYYPWENDYAARYVVSQLDAQISTVVGQVQSESADYGSRLHYVPTNGTNSPFAGHGICDSGTSYFQNVDQAAIDKSYVFHPNTSGHQAYASIIAGDVGNG